MVKPQNENAWSDFRVGLITFSALILLAIAIISTGGDKGLLFQKKMMVRAHLTNVGGLKKGSSVTMGGMNVGKVANIAFVGGSDVNLIEVTMQVRSDVREKIKVDSVPSVRTQGMLGDRYMDLSIGSKDAEALPEENFLIGQASTDFDETLHRVVDVLSETQKLLGAINRQEGTVGQLFYDERFYGNLVKVTDELNDLIKDFKKQPRRYIKFSMF